jgi:hypothetical protein
MPTTYPGDGANRRHLSHLLRYQRVVPRHPTSRWLPVPLAVATPWPMSCHHRTAVLQRPRGRRFRGGVGGCRRVSPPGKAWDCGTAPAHFLLWWIPRRGAWRFQVIGATVWTSLAHVVGGLGCGCQAPGLVCRAAQGLVSRAVICHSRAGRAIGFVGDLCRVGGVAPGVSESRASLRSVPSGRPCGPPLTPPHQALGGR